MLFPLICVMDYRYNLKSTKYVTTQIMNSLNLDAHITYLNLEKTLTSMYEVYTQRLVVNISWVPFMPILSTNLEEDKA